MSLVLSPLRTVTAYWLMYLCAALPVLGMHPASRAAVRSGHIERSFGPWVPILLVLTVLIGFRVEVGGDWFNYFRYLRLAAVSDAQELFGETDPAYWLLNYYSISFGWGITGVNVVCAALFSVGLVTFCRAMPRPALALAVAVPYLIIVVGMGYSRQAVALGLAMIGLTALGRQRYLQFALWVVIGATFHRSAALLIPIAALTATRNRLFIGTLVLATAALTYDVLLADTADELIATYVDSNIQSSGALIRLAMNLLPAILILLFGRHMEIPAAQQPVWRLFSLISVGMFFMYFVLPLSTALDRMALYFIPLQLVAFSYLPYAARSLGFSDRGIEFGILAYYAFVLFIWLNFAVHARFWIPYQFVTW